jgi:phage gp46-like protein
MQVLLDPTTGDYVFTEGSPLNDPAGGLGNAVYVRLKTPLGSYWADPSVGSRLHELAREKDTPRIRGLYEQYCEQALKPIVQDGRAESITVNALAVNGWLVLLIKVIGKGTPITFRYPVKVL